MKQWDAGSIVSIPYAGMFAVVTSRNYQTQEFTARYFDTFEEADRWNHDTSLAQLPEWHKAYCTKYGCRDTEES